MDITQFIPDLGSGFIIGFITGWAAKKAIKVLIALIGLYLLSLLYLANLGVIRINEDALLALIGSAENSVITYGSQLTGLIHSISLGGGFAVGFTLGFKKG